MITKRVSIGGAQDPTRLITGRYYESSIVSVATTIPSEAQAIYGTFWQPAGYRIDDLSLEVTVAGTAGAVVRLGVYGQASNGQPGPVLVDAGTIDGTSVTFQTLPAVVAAPSLTRLVFLTAAVQGVAGTRPTVRTGVALTFGPGSSSVTSDLSAARGALVSLSISGAFQANPALHTGGANFVPRVFVRGTQL